MVAPVAQSTSVASNHALNHALIERFAQAARAAWTTVERVETSAAAIAAAVRRAAPAAQRIAVAQPLDLPAELFAECRRLPGVLGSPATKSQLATADLGITDAFAGVASSGSVCIAIDEGDAGAISLLPRMHIAVVAASAIVARPRDLFGPGAAGNHGLRRNFVFITGPSATADMGPLVRGVHGPHRLHIVVLV